MPLFLVRHCIIFFSFGIQQYCMLLFIFVKARDTFFFFLTFINMPLIFGETVHYTNYFLSGIQQYFIYFQCDTSNTISFIFGMQQNGMRHCNIPFILFLAYSNMPFIFGQTLRFTIYFLFFFVAYSNMLFIFNGMLQYTILFIFFQHIAISIYFW